ncbi:MAG: hypothetical protein ACFHHU_13785 [Porticoccaceae bacterium]
MPSWTLDGEDKDLSLFKTIKNTYEQGGEQVLSAYTDNASVVVGNKAGRFSPSRNPVNIGIRSKISTC